MVKRRSKPTHQPLSMAGKGGRQRRLTSRTKSLVVAAMVAMLGLAILVQSGGNYTTDQLLSEAVENAQIVQMTLQEIVANTSFPFPVDTSDHSSTGQTESSNSKTAGKALASPPKCTNEQLNIIQRQLDPSQCRRTSRFPWQNKCSFSYATRCPDARWLTDFYEYHRPSTPRSSAIYVGCNKGMDAVNGLRMISGDEKYDKDRWKSIFSRNKTMSEGHCGQENDAQFSISKSQTIRNDESYLHCIEAMPITARELTESAKELGWQKNFIVSNVAMGIQDGTVYFPNVVEKVGAEGHGAMDCYASDAQRQSNLQKVCAEVPLFTLDTYVKQQQSLRDQRIDYVSIDVEGFDQQVLLGANTTLSRIGYVEFEFNWKGPWGKVKKPMSSTIDFMKDHGFVCYWAGSHGNLWRITDCFHEYYNLHFWSNVGCVNQRDSLMKPMLRQMEQMFNKTLSFRDKISYKRPKSANTNGQLYKF